MIDEGRRVTINFNMLKFAVNVPVKWRNAGYNPVFIELDFFDVGEFGMSYRKKNLRVTINIEKMKLIGSKQEHDFRRELEGSNIVSSQDDKAEAILNVLRTTFGEVKSAYILNWTPDQSEDIFTILVKLDRIAKIEISRVNHSEVPRIETFNLKDFQRGLSKIFRIKLAVVIDLAKKEHPNS